MIVSKEHLRLFSEQTPLGVSAKSSSGNGPAGVYIDDFNKNAPIVNWFPMLPLGMSRQQQPLDFILAQNLNQPFSKKERN